MYIYATVIICMCMYDLVYYDEPPKVWIKPKQNYFFGKFNTLFY